MDPILSSTPISSPPKGVRAGAGTPTDPKSAKFVTKWVAIPPFLTSVAGPGTEFRCGSSRGGPAPSISTFFSTIFGPRIAFFAKKSIFWEGFLTVWAPSTRAFLPKSRIFENGFSTEPRNCWSPESPFLPKSRIFENGFAAETRNFWSFPGGPGGPPGAPPGRPRGPPGPPWGPRGPRGPRGPCLPCLPFKGSAARGEAL